LQNVNRPRVDPKQVRKSLLIWGIVAVVVIAGTQVGWGNIWREGLIRPFLNALLFLYTYLGQSFIVAITVFTVLLRLLTMPLQVKQIRSTKRMSALQPRIAELQKRYGGDKERLMREQQALYKTAGVSPFGGCLPTLVQFPIWIGLYQSINAVLADTPLELMNLGKNIYVGFQALVDVIPLQSKFLWLNLAQPDPTPFVLPVLVGATMWLQQKMMTQPSGDTQQASMNQTMQIMMPLMFGYFTTQFASGLALYFLISNVVGIIMQWAIERLEKPAVVAPAEQMVVAAANDKEKAPYGRKKQRRKSKR
jgi:YidC/Oxa1 family membrane protein insertase